MKSKYQEFKLITTRETEMINITAEVNNFVQESGIRSGMVYVMSFHTTSGITVNEGLLDIETDIMDLLHTLAPDDHAYHHARFLHSDGQMAVNATSHLRSSLLGFEVFFPVEEGEMKSGGRQTIYFVELDGPQERTWCIKIIGD
jgi:secondary thiamine-phosphate synthase enzyme